MKIRFVKPNEKNRAMIRLPFTVDVIQISEYLMSIGYVPVGLIKYWLHVVFWRKRKKD